MLRCLLACTLSVVTGSLLAATPPAVDVATYFRAPDIREVRMSPSGKYFAALAPSTGGRIGLAIMSFEKRDPKVIAVVDGYDIESFSWVNDNRLVYSVFDAQAGLGEQNGGGLFAVDREGNSTRMLAPTAKMQEDSGALVGHSMALLNTLHDGSDDILVVANETSDYPDVYRVNTVTGKKTLQSLGKPGNVVSWVADADGKVRGAITEEDKGLATQAWWKPPGSDQWEAIGKYGLRDAQTIPVAFDGDGSMIVASNVGRDTLALYRWDAARKAPDEQLAAYARADFGEGSRFVYDPRKKKIVGTDFDFERAGAAWFDDDWARVQATIDKALPDTVNLLSRGDANVYLVTAFSDTNPGTWYLLDADKGTLELLGKQRKAIDPARMAKRKAVRYAARDGLEIPAFLTLPPGREAKNLPLVLLVHGGPYMRGTHWNWNPEAAYLAALGYAVLEPEFRGSQGWGRKLSEGGIRQWGRAMQDDLNDGMDYLAKQGIVDPKRACIMGASYGGYAVLEGLARDSDRWRCGIDYVGVSDINLLFSVSWSDSANSNWINYEAKDVIGDPDKDAAMLKSVSPLEHAANIKAPVLMAYGGSDRRVPVIHGEKMRDALVKNGTPVEWVVYQEEAHGFLLEKNRYDFYNRVAAFLNKYLPAYP